MKNRLETIEPDDLLEILRAHFGGNVSFLSMHIEFEEDPTDWPGVYTRRNAVPRLRIAMSSTPS